MPIHADRNRRLKLETARASPAPHAVHAATTGHAAGGGALTGGRPDRQSNKLHPGRTMASSRGRMNFSHPCPVTTRRVMPTGVAEAAAKAVVRVGVTAGLARVPARRETSAAIQAKARAGVTTAAAAATVPTRGPVAHSPIR